MSDIPTPPAISTEPPPASTETTALAPKFSWGKTFLMTIPYIALYATAIWLVAITDSEPVRAGVLWQWFIPAVGVVAIYGGWRRMRAGQDGPALYLFKQVLHWGATFLVIYGLFWPTLQAFLTADTHGFVAIYVLGLSTLLAGIHLDWKMFIFGLFLIGSGVAIAFFDDNAMLMTLIGIALVGIVLSLIFRSRHRH